MNYLPLLKLLIPTKSSIANSIRNNKVTSICITAVVISATYQIYRNKSITDRDYSTITKFKNKEKVDVDGVFLSRLWKILKIILPLRSRAFSHLVMLTLLLYTRTLLSIKVAEITGLNAKFIVEKRLLDIIMGVAAFALLGIPSSMVNSALRYETAMLSLTFRKRLTDYVHEQYLKGTNFYKASNLGGDSRIDNADQRVTQDIELFCESLSELYSTIFKPLLDVVLNTFQLSSLLSTRAPLLLLAYYVLSASTKRAIMPAFGKLAVRSSELEGDYRTAHQRLITNSEEIAFYDGSSREKSIITTLFSALYTHEKYTYYLQYLVGIFDEYLVKYGASIAGYAVLALPVIEGTVSKKTAADLTKDYVRNKQLLVNLAKGSAKLIVLSNMITSLAGLTARVSGLLEMMQKLDEAGVEPFKIKSNDTSSSESEDVDTTKEEELAFLEDFKQRALDLKSKMTKEVSTISTQRTQVNEKAKYLLGDVIKFEDVTLVNPDGRLLVEGLTFEVKLHQNVVVTGPNGSGKSSLFRVLGELWPLHSGTITKPRNCEILFVPQKPYLVLGTLRDQIIYPHSKQDMMRAGVTDRDLEMLLQVVDPSSTIRGQWEWDEVRDWFSAFSGGQKQRIGMARLFYHRPTFGILDECTSAVSIEVEGKIYKTCAKLGITLFTVSHRESLRKYHDYELHLTGTGSWTWTKVEK